MISTSCRSSWPKGYTSCSNVDPYAPWKAHAILYGSTCTPIPNASPRKIFFVLKMEGLHFGQACIWEENKKPMQRCSHRSTKHTQRACNTGILLEKTHKCKQTCFCRCMFTALFDVKNVHQFYKKQEFTSKGKGAVGHVDNGSPMYAAKAIKRSCMLHCIYLFPPAGVEGSTTYRTARGQRGG